MPALRQRPLFPCRHTLRHHAQQFKHQRYPQPCRAASGIDQFDELLASATDRAPTQKLATIEDVGAMAAFLASPGARNLTGGVHDIDGGFSITA